MFLFVFAFLGNTFYVLSILTSPAMSEDFLLESMPYVSLWSSLK
jgi:solute carrier family 66 (lysosomal lysine-arginine transporter), member 1